MRAVVQRVSSAVVRVGDEVAGQIGLGLLVYLGVGRGDGPADLDYMERKISSLRIFPDLEGKMNLSLLDAAASVLLVSQFTLYGDVRKGNRPAFDSAELPGPARELYLDLAARLRLKGITVELGVFQASMHVESVNLGPVTILLESKRLF
jgi:D-tyrosyl-tRNA(Tyr) deacylase